MDNLRLIVIAAIFIGIIGVLLYRRFAKSGRKKESKYMRATNPYDSGSKEKRHSAGVVDDFMSIEEKIKAEKGEESEDISEQAVEEEEEPVVNFEKIEEIIKSSEAEIITKFAAVIKDVRAKIDTKLTAETENIRVEFTTKIENLISKIEEREKEVVSKIENIIDTKVQEALNKMNDRVGAALHAQKNSTASVLEKLVDSLRTAEVPAGDSASEKREKVVEEKVDCEGVEKKDFWSMLKETSVKDKGILGELASSLQTDDASDSVSSSDESKAAVEEPVGSSSTGGSNASVDEDIVPAEIKEEELEVLSEDNAGVKLDAKELIASPGENEEKVSGKAVGDSADFDMQAFLNEEPVGSSSTDGSDASVDEDIVPAEIKEEELEVLSEDNAGVKLDAKELIASPGENEEKVSGKAVGDSADFDMQAFLNEEPVGSSSTDGSDASVEEDVVPTEIKEESSEVPSEDKADVKLEAKELIASSGEIEENVPEKEEGDSADFDIQEFLDELENLPSEQNPEAEK